MSDRTHHRADVDEADRRDLQPSTQPTGRIRELEVDERPRRQNKGDRSDVPANHVRPARIISGPVRLDPRRSHVTTQNDQHHADHGVGNEQLDVAGLVCAPFRRDAKQTCRQRSPAQLLHG